MASLFAWNQTSEEFKAQITGKLLGDGSLTQQRDRKPRFQFTHMAKDYEWSLFCYLKLRTHLRLNPPRFRKTWDSRLKKGYFTAYYTQSKTSDLTTSLRNAWYNKSPLFYLKSILQLRRWHGDIWMMII